MKLSLLLTNILAGQYLPSQQTALQNQQGQLDVLNIGTVPGYQDRSTTIAQYLTLLCLASGRGKKTWDENQSHRSI